MRLYAFAFAMCVIACGARAEPQSAVSGEEALAVLDECIVRLDPALDVGYARVAMRCPNLTHSLERSGWVEWLPRGWKEARNDLSAGSLVELRALLARELTAAPVSRAPHIARLDEVLNGLGPAAQEHDSLWSRFRAWLRSVIERNQQADRRSWLDKMIQSNGRSQTFIDWVTYIALGAIVILAALIVVNELRMAGLLRSEKRKTVGEAGLDPRPHEALGGSDIERAASAQKPGLLLELVVAKLAERGKIPPARALTVRQLRQSVELASAEDRARLDEIAAVAEQVRYSAAALSSATIDGAVNRGRELLARLDAVA